MSVDLHVSPDPGGVSLAELRSTDAGPKRATSLHERRSPLASPEFQRDVLRSLDLPAPAVESGAGAPAEETFADGSATQPSHADFATAVARHGWAPLRPSTLQIFQINVGRLCNMTCRHCHVDAGPDRIAENMDRATMELCLAALDRTSAHTVDVTGGAPELNPHFRWLVDQCVARGKHVIDRCNLTVLLLPRFVDLPEWLGARGVEVVCSLPHYRRPSTDAQRGDGTFDRSLEALRRLNAAGYGRGDPSRRLTLMTNPAGAFLAPSQTSLEKEWKEALARHHGVTFDRLIALNNMPIARFLEWLLDKGCLDEYMQRLTRAFNPGAIAGLMCRNTISVSWDGRLYDCDFNQMLDLEVALPEGTPASSSSAAQRPAHVRDLDPDALARRNIVTGRHCFGCTAGAGSSCGGATT